jgi:hypothetical protein
VDEKIHTTANNQSLTWPPTPGAHSIQLLDEQNRVLDEMRVIVRGIPNPAAGHHP